MRRFIRVVIMFLSLTGAVVLSFPTAGGAAITPRTALMYGDSLTYESRSHITAQLQLKTGWQAHVHSFGGTALCDWLPWIADDLAAYHPSVVGLETAGNPGSRPCSAEVPGSAAYYADYRVALNTFFSQVTASGAKVVYFTPPPFTDPVRTQITKQITAMATELAFQYHGVSIATSMRNALAGSGGAYTETKPCLLTETAAMGCTAGRIAIRTVAGLVDAGLHLCPTGIGSAPLGVCPVYSSGEFRFGRAVANSLAVPPKPKLP